MKKLLALILATMLLFVACDPNIGGDVPSTPGSSDTPVGPGPGPDEQPSEIEWNLVNKGDFENRDENSRLDGNSWGSSSDVVIVANPDGAGKVAKFDASSAVSYAWFTNFYDFEGTGGTFSAKVKLENPEAYDDIKLMVEYNEVDTSDGNKIGVNGERTQVSDVTLNQNTEWQELSFHVEPSAHAYSTNFKIEVALAAASVVYIDDVKFIPDDLSSVNFLGYSSFDKGDLADNANSKKWKKIPSTGGEDWPTDTSVALSSGEVLETAVEWVAGGFTNPSYPLDNVDYPNVYDGSFSINVEGKGTVALQVEIKSNDNHELYNQTSEAFEVDGSATIRVAVPKQSSEAAGTIVHIRCQSGEVNVHSASLKVSE